MIRVALSVARKDLLSEWRGRELLPALAQFMLLALVIAVFAFDLDGQSVPRVAPGILWLTLVFAALLAFSRAYGAERELASLEAMLLSPAPRAGLFLGKALAGALLLVACEAVLLPALAVLLGFQVTLALVLAVLLATAGMAGVGSLFAALAAQTRARELLLPALALPLWIPLVVLAVRAFQGGGQGVALLVDFDILFLVVASLAARFVLDD
ncbi:MAG TPA: heme exporter protein CcmB [Candidatus Acidoferrales bacterium]|nr:heme exporter protein CcmB [Candidatus Acidoferrales bacterium]